MASARKQQNREWAHLRELLRSLNYNAGAGFELAPLREAYRKARPGIALADPEPEFARIEGLFAVDWLKTFVERGRFAGT